MRLHKIVLTDLLNDRLVAYEELERVMNKEDKIANTTYHIKEYLEKIVKLNAMIDEWQQIIQSEVKNPMDELTNKIKEEING